MTLNVPMKEETESLFHTVIRIQEVRGEDSAKL